jgi:hypothetical protein
MSFLAANPAGFSYLSPCLVPFGCPEVGKFANSALWSGYGFHGGKRNP